MKINKKGFAVSTMLYGLIFVTIAIFYLIITIVSSRHVRNLDYVATVREDLEMTGELLTSLNAKINSSNSVYESGTTYLSGTSSAVNFNYVWYSGKLWRIVAIYSDGTMKLVTDDVITVIAAGPSDYNNLSYAYIWLNNDFKDTLYNSENLLVTDYKWNKAAVAESSYQYALPDTDSVKISGTVGLLNVHEYYKAGQNSSESSNYLNNSRYYWLMNANSSGSGVYNVSSSGTISSADFISEYGIRPAIVLRSHIYMNGGDGTSNNPYTIQGDKGAPVSNNSLLNTRISGEYLEFEGKLYRIVSIETDGSVRIISDQYFRSSGSILNKYFYRGSTFGTSMSGSSTLLNDFWDYYLNNWYPSRLTAKYRSLLVRGTFFREPISDNDYRTGVCSLVEPQTTVSYCIKNSKFKSRTGAYAGVSRYGELFSAQNNSDNYSSMLVLPDYAIMSNGTITNSRRGGVRPVLFIKNTTRIIRGVGTKRTPFIIA